MNRSNERNQTKAFIAWNLPMTYGVTMPHISLLQWILPPLTDACLLNHARNSACFFGVCVCGLMPNSPQKLATSEAIKRDTLCRRLRFILRAKPLKKKTSFNWQRTQRQFPRATAWFWNPRFFTPERFYWHWLSFSHTHTGDELPHNHNFIKLH